MCRWRAILPAALRSFSLLAMSAAVVGCSNSSGSGVSVAHDSSPVSRPDSALGTTPDDASGNSTAPTTPPSTIVPQVWDAISAPSNCMCSDGSSFHFFLHRADPTKVVFFLEGGGACFDAGTCGPSSTTFRRTVDHDDNLADTTHGIFDFTDARNPFKNWSVVYVPYCTGDVHLGNITRDYGNGVVIHHNGFVNASTVLNALAQFFPGTATLVVAGESAGSIAAPLFAGMAHDLLPAATIKVLADGSGAYSDIPAINTVIGTAWGTPDAIPPWPENQGQTVATWSIPGLFIQAHKHDPRIVFARHDYAFDEVQATFSALAGIPAGQLDILIDTNGRQIRATGTPLSSFVSPGARHTVLAQPRFYSEAVDGTSLLAWVSDFVAGKPVADVHCTDCKNG